MKAVILAAGKGTRLGALTKHTPKPLIKISDKPILQHIVEGIAKAGVKDFTIITRYLAEQIKDYFCDGSKFGVNIEYITQPDDKYGTAAALMAAEKTVARDEPVMLGWGDIITAPQTYSGVFEMFNANDISGVISLNYMDDPSAGGAVYPSDDESKIVKIVEKPAKGTALSHWNSAGIFVFKPVIFEYLKHVKPSARGEYEIADAINMMISDGLVIKPYFLNDIWCDVGRPEDIPTAEKIISMGS